MRKLLLLAVFGAMIMSFGVQANLFKLTVTNYDGAAPALLNPLVATLENKVNANLPDADASSYLGGMADSSVFAGKGIGVDYGSDIDLFLVGANVGVGVDVGDNSFSDLVGGDVDGEQMKGFGLGASILGGLNLGFIPYDRLLGLKLEKTTVFFNFFAYDIDKDDMKAEYKSLGVHLQYLWYKEKTFVPLGMLEWTGVKLTAGYEINMLKASFIETITQTFTDTDLGVPGTGATGAATGILTVGADITTHSIPLEISTGMQWLYLMTTYVGAGIDLNFGSASAVTGGTATVTLDDGIGHNPTVAGALQLGQDSSPTTFTGRIFLGHQFNISLVKLGFMLTKGVGNDLYAAHLGLKLTW